MLWPDPSRQSRVIQSAENHLSPPQLCLSWCDREASLVRETLCATQMRFVTSGAEHFRVSWLFHIQEKEKLAT